MIDKQLGEFMWAQKYRPQKVDDVILPEAIKTSIKENIKDGKCSNFLFDGSPGTGKTTLAMAIANELDAEVLYLNGSGKDRGVDIAKYDIPNFCSAVSLDKSHKIVLYDEADYLTNDSMAALRGTIEKFSKNCSFIMTCNNKNRITEAIRSRFVEIDFRLSKDDEKSLKVQLLKRLVSIVRQEINRDLSKEQISVVAQVVEKFFPNNRKVLNMLQTMTNSGNLDASGLTIISEDRFDDVVEYIQGKKWSKMREWVAENDDIPVENIINFFWDHGEDKFGIKNMPLIILNVDDYQRHVDLVRNPILATVSLFTKIMQQIQ